MKRYQNLLSMVFAGLFLMVSCGKSKEEKASVSSDPYDQLKACSEDHQKLLSDVSAQSNQFDLLPDQFSDKEIKAEQAKIAMQFEAELKELKSKFEINGKEDHCFFRLNFDVKELAIKKNINSLYDSSFVKLLDDRLVKMKNRFISSLL